MAVPAVRLLKRCVNISVQALWDSLVLFGSCWVPIPTAPIPGNQAERERKAEQEPDGHARQTGQTGECPDGSALTDPAPSHPERLCPGKPLSPLERALQQELGKDCDRLSRRLGDSTPPDRRGRPAR